MKESRRCPAPPAPPPPWPPAGKTDGQPPGLCSLLWQRLSSLSGGPSLCVHSCSHGCHRPTRRCYKRPQRPRGCPILRCGGRRQPNLAGRIILGKSSTRRAFKLEVCQPSFGESKGGKGSIYRQNKILSGGRESAVLFVAAACT